MERPRLRQVLSVAAYVMLLAVLGFAAWRSYALWKPTHPMSVWLSVRYAKAVAGTAVFALASYCAGDLVLRRALRLRLPLRDHLTFALPTGFMAFFLAMYVLGTIGLLGPFLFFALPLAFVGVGTPSLLRLWRSLRGRRLSRFAIIPVRLVPFLVLGVIALVVLYAPVLVSEPNYDSRWYHLRIAEHYVAQGRIRRFPEGWTPGAMPQLASLLFTWAFQMPGDVFDHVLLSSHLEMLALLCTLPAIGAFVRAVVPRASGAGLWPSLFLFPTIFICNLKGTSDHVAPVFALPAVLALFLAWKTLAVRPSLLAAIMISGLIVTKYTAVVLVVPIMLAVTVRAVFLGVKSLLARRSFWAGTVGAWVMLGAGLLLTAPFWLKNIVYYGNPVYPVNALPRIFHNRPWHQDATQVFAAWTQGDLSAQPFTREGLKGALGLLYDFGGDNHELGGHTGNLPIFGLAFTLMACTLPFVRARGRLWGAFALGYGAVAVWLFMAQQERYLEVILPLVAACTAAAFVLVWRAGILARLALAPLLFVQITWSLEGSLIAFDGAWLPRLTSLAHTTPQAGSDRYHLFGPWSDIGQSLKPRSKVLEHEFHDALGLGHAGVQDFPQWQFGLDYARLGDARSIHDKLREYGVTHVLWNGGRSKGHDSIGGDLAFFRFVERHLRPAAAFGSFRLAELQAVPPPPPSGEDWVAFLGCGESYASGFYHLDDLHMTSWGPPPPEAHPRPREPLEPFPASTRVVLDKATFLVHSAECGGVLPASIGDRFTVLVSRNGYELFLRKL